MLTIEKNLHICLKTKENISVSAIKEYPNAIMLLLTLAMDGLVDVGRQADRPAGPDGRCRYGRTERND